MSKVLSIYNEWAFREVVLPSIANTEHSIVLDAELFHLSRNELVELECIRGEWFFKELTNGNSIEAAKKDMDCSSALPSRGRYILTSAHGIRLTILVEEKNSPLSVFQKFALISGKSISIGAAEDNAIRYRYPGDREGENFVSQHHCYIVTNAEESYLEDRSSNGTYVNHARVEGRCTLHFGDTIRIFGLSMVFLGNMLAVSALYGMECSMLELNEKALRGYETPGLGNGNSDKTVFYRAPRSVPVVNLEAISIDPPPAPQEMPGTPLYLQIGPALTMALPMMMGSGLAFLSSRMSGSTGNIFMLTGIITAILSALIGVFWTLMNLRHNKKSIRERNAYRLEKYGRYLEEKTKQIRAMYEEYSRALKEKYLGADEVALYTDGNEKLWNRNVNHRDFLSYRLGVGDLPFTATIDVQKEKFTMVDDDLEKQPREIKKEFSVMHRVPVCIDLRDKSLVGVIGSTNLWIDIIKNLIVQIAGNNSYTDVKIAFVYDEHRLSNAQIWEFVKWLPHAWSEDKEIRFYATNKQQASEVFYALSQVLRTRQEESGRTRPYYILFVLNKELLEGELITKYISHDSDSIGFSTVIVAEHYEELPNNCEQIIENNVDFSGYYNTINEDSGKCAIEFDHVSTERLMRFAKKLSNIEINEVENGGEVPDSISFFDMYGISRPQELDAGDRWRRSKPTETMKALIGLKNGGAPCYLDIHERYHGPHGLVAGTTGSGKSETLQTYLLSLAINYSPDDIGFFIIDYKGGGMANLFNGLPHMIGSVSNLSGNQVKRAMVSIKSENKRRQKIFTVHGVNNINAYTSLYKNGDAKEPIPHLFIIIDEFAELKREEPDFMRELISVAQVGRSLGVHLILSTQKPAGTVDENIWSNSKFRLCLRVQDRQDSMDMLHRADAAYLTQAGRGFLQVGNDEIFELFQSGYSGAAYDETLGDKKLVVAQMLDSVGKVDLVGNHFKIRYQEDARRAWIALVCEAIRAAGEMVQLSEDDDNLISDEMLREIYQYIQSHGGEYKSSGYNDARLRDMARLYYSMEETESGVLADRIIDLAAKKGMKLPEARTKNQLEAINEYLAQVAVENGYTNSISLWMPVLPEYMLLTDIEGYRDFELAETDTSLRKGWSLSAVVGKGDDPENQNQMPILVDFANGGHHALCATVSTGKSTFLQTAIYGLINKYDSDELNIYILDFSSKLLTVFDGAKQVGGIMTDSDDDAEKIAKYFMMMGQIMEDRKKLLASSNFRDFVEHGTQKLPAIVVVIDNYAAFREKTGERYEEIVKQIAKEGLNYGIFLLVTAGGFGSSEIPNRLADNFRTVMSLEMSDIYQYSDVMRVVRVPLYPESNVKGRGLVHSGDRILEFQTALACAGESIFDRNANIRKRIDQINSIGCSKHARRIPTIPVKPLWEEYVREDEYEKLIANSRMIPNGYDAETAEYSAIDLTSMLTYIVSGTKKSGKSTYMKTLIRACADKGCEVCVIEVGSDEFRQVAEATGSAYITDGDGIYHFAKTRLLAECGVRRDQKLDGMNRHLDEEEFFDAMDRFRKLCIFIPNVKGFVDEVYNKESQAYQALNVYEMLTGDKGAHYQFYFFLEVEDQEYEEVAGYQIVRQCRQNGRGIRFGGKYLSQKLFEYANVPYKIKSAATKAGLGVIPSEDESAVLQRVVVPNYKG